MKKQKLINCLEVTTLWNCMPLYQCKKPRGRYIVFPCLFFFHFPLKNNQVIHHKSSKTNITQNENNIISFFQLKKKKNRKKKKSDTKFPNLLTKLISYGILNPGWSTMEPLTAHCASTIHLFNLYPKCHPQN